MLERVGVPILNTHFRALSKILEIVQERGIICPVYHHFLLQLEKFEVLHHSKSWESQLLLSESSVIPLLNLLGNFFLPFLAGFLLKVILKLKLLLNKIIVVSILVLDKKYLFTIDVKCFSDEVISIVSGEEGAEDHGTVFCANFDSMVTDH